MPYYNGSFSMKLYGKDASVFYKCDVDNGLICDFCGGTNAQKLDGFKIIEIEVDYQTIDLSSLSGKRLVSRSIKTLGKAYSKAVCVRSMCSKDFNKEVDKILS